MTNKEADPGAFARPKPELGGILLNGVSVKGGVFQKGERGKGWGMGGVGD